LSKILLIILSCHDIFFVILCFSENELAWKDDIEFGRQMLAGTHPTRIQCLTVLLWLDLLGIEFVIVILIPIIRSSTYH